MFNSVGPSEPSNVVFIISGNIGSQIQPPPPASQTLPVPQSGTPPGIKPPSSSQIKPLPPAPQSGEAPPFIFPPSSPIIPPIIPPVEPPQTGEGAEESNIDLQRIYFTFILLGLGGIIGAILILRRH